MFTVIFVLQILLVTTRLVSWALFGLIYFYLKNKTPAMQTIFDEMVKELIITTICSWIVISGIYLLIEVQLSRPSVIG